MHLPANSEPSASLSLKNLQNYRPCVSPHCDLLSAKALPTSLDSVLPSPATFFPLPFEIKPLGEHHSVFHLLLQVLLLGKEKEISCSQHLPLFLPLDSVYRRLPLLA